MKTLRQTAREEHNDKTRISKERYDALEEVHKLILLLVGARNKFECLSATIQVFINHRTMDSNNSWEKMADSF